MDDEKTRTHAPKPHPDGETFPTEAAALARELNLPLGDTRDPDGTLTQSPTSGERIAAGVVEVPGYEVLEELGRGGMGVVYKARQQGLNRLVALKMVIAGPYASPSTRARFLLEAESVAALEHPHVVRVFAFGEHAGHPFLAMEFLPGGTLADRDKVNGPLPPREAAEVVAKLAAAVSHAHAKGVVHRDIKPGNVLLTADGEPRLTDFGLAKVGRSDMTATGAVLGTPAYMSPEQAAGRTKEVGASSDVYSLGAVLFDLLTGMPPFSGDSVAVTLQKVMSEPAPSPRSRVPAVPHDLDTICLKCLEKNSTDRYPSADALADDLRRFVAGEPILARPAGRVERTLRWAKRRRVGIALAVMAVVLQVGIAVGLYHGLALPIQEPRLAETVPPVKNDDAEPATRAPEYRALLVGCENYAPFDLKESVHGSARLATEFQDVLLTRFGFPEENVSTLVAGPDSSRPTRVNIENALRKLGEVSQDGDQVVIFLSGVGLLFQNTASHRSIRGFSSKWPEWAFLAEGHGRWSPGELRDNRRDHMIDMVALLYLVKPILDRGAYVWLLIDTSSCPDDVLEGIPVAWPELSKRLVISCACRGHEAALESMGPNPQSLFGRALVDALKRPLPISYRGFWDIVQREVKTNAAPLRQQAEIYGGNTQGFVLGLATTEATRAQERRGEVYTTKRRENTVQAFDAVCRLSWPRETFFDVLVRPNIVSYKKVLMGEFLRDPFSLGTEPAEAAAESGLVTPLPRHEAADAAEVVLGLPIWPPESLIGHLLSPNRQFIGDACRRPIGTTPFPAGTDVRTGISPP